MQDDLIRDSEWRHRLISEVIADYIFVIDVDADGNLKFTWASDNLMEHTGRTLEDALTPDLWRTIVHPDYVGQLEDFIRQMLTTTEKGELECRSYHKEGSERWIRIYARRRTGPDGRPTHLVGAVREITGQKKIELQLLNSEKKYRRLHSSMTDAFVATDMQGRIRECNESYSRLLGYSEEELMRLSYLDLTPEKWHEKEASIVMHEILPKGSSAVYEKEYRAKDGRIIPVEMRTFLVRDDEGSPSLMWAIVRDISERKRTEEKLRAALEEKETLLREVHHRVKNNLQTVMTLIELRSPVIKDQHSLRVISELKEQIRTISFLYQELFQSERVSRVAMQPYFEMLLKYLLKTFRNGTSVRVDVECRETVLDAEWAMPCGLIVNELVTNALKHAFPAGFTQEAVINIRLWNEGERHTLQVSDNGAGFSGHTETTNPNSIGLQLVSLWAKNQMNGTLDITNHTGTCFTITFNT